MPNPRSGREGNSGANRPRGGESGRGHQGSTNGRGAAPDRRGGAGTGGQGRGLPPRDGLPARQGLPPRTRRKDAPPPKQARDRVARPELPEDRPGLPRAARREIERVASNKGKADEIVAAMAFGAERLEYDDPKGALTYLRWARQEAGTAICVRELVGIALYLSGEYAEARKELQSYRRMSQSNDQNHLIADCLRALGRDQDQIPELVESMVDVDRDRQVEGRIVWASHVADEGDPVAALSILTPALKVPTGKEPDEVAARAWYVAGDLAERAGRVEQAKDWFRKVVEVGDDWDAADRLDALG